MVSNRLYGNEYKYLLEVLETDFRASHGASMMARFERAFADRFGVKHGIACVNGTATMHAALEAMGIGVGDEVIVPPMTMASTTFAVMHANATPVFADIDPDTFQISAESVREKVTEKTRAIITVSLFGMCPDYDEILKIAEEYSLKVIEDNAENFLGEYKSKLVGTIGDCASYSFQNSKHLTSGEGGIVITNNDDLALKIRQIVSLGYAGVSTGSGKVARTTIQDPNYMRHVTLGWNYRMPELCCAVALGQVENIDELVSKRIYSGSLFEAVCKDYPDLITAQKVPDGYKHSYWAFAANLNTDRVSWHEFRDQFAKFGGDGIYACWQLTYNEPFVKDRKFLNRENMVLPEKKFLSTDILCKNAEYLQPRILQFKTNYWDPNTAIIQAKILEKTLKFFSRSN